jgi:glycosyltransferase involved in cell wall biosynthesis
MMQPAQPERSAPRVSVITTAYNVAPYLADAIESALAQSMSDLELLIVDDGSTDESLRIARRYAAGDPRVRIFATGHQGVSGARDTGVRAARGEWVGFLDGDDVWERDFLARQLDFVQSQPESCVGSFCWSRGIARDGRPRRLAHAPAPGRYHLARMLQGICPPGNGSSLFIRRSALAQAGPFHPTLVGEDIEMWYRLLRAAPDRHFVCLPEILTRYRERPGSLTATRLKERVAEKAWVFGTYAAGLARRDRFDAFLRFVRHAERNGSPQLLRQWSVAAARCSPHRLLASGDGLFALAVLLGGARAAQAIQARLLSLLERLDGRTRLDRRSKRTPPPFRRLNTRALWIAFWFQLTGRDGAPPVTVLRLGEPTPGTPAPDLAGQGEMVTSHEEDVAALRRFGDRSFDVVVAVPGAAALTPGGVDTLARDAARVARRRVALSLPATRNWARRISRFVEIRDDYPCPLRPGCWFFECTPRHADADPVTRPAAAPARRGHAVAG